MLRIRLSRAGKKKVAAYNVVVMEKSFRRDGRFVEKIGYYQPTLKNDDPFRLNINPEGYAKWKKNGAQPSEKVQKLAHILGLDEAPIYNESPTKSSPKKDRKKA